MAGASRSANGSLPKRSRQRHPAGHRAGHGDACPSRAWRRAGVVAVLARKYSGVQAAGAPPDWRSGRAAAGRPRGCRRRREPRPLLQRLDDRHRRRRGDRRIDRVAARQQHAQAGLRGQRVRGGDDVAGEHRQALAGVAGGPVEGRTSSAGLLVVRVGGGLRLAVQAAHAQPHAEGDERDGERDGQVGRDVQPGRLGALGERSPPARRRSR